jgi:hypothetical protein
LEVQRSRLDVLLHAQRKFPTWEETLDKELEKQDKDFDDCVTMEEVP